MPYRSFSVSKATIASLYLRAKKIGGVVVFVPLVTVFAIHLLEEKTIDSSASLISLGVTVVILTAILAWGYFKRIKTWKNTVERYEVRLKDGEYVSVNNPRGQAMADSTVVEDVGGMNWKTLYREDIASITYYTGKQIIVTSKDGRTVVTLSTRLESFDELLVVIATLGKIEKKSGSNWQLKRFLLRSAPAFVLLAALLINNPWVKVVGGVLAAAGYGYQIFAILKFTKKSERKTSQLLFKVIAVLLSIGIVLGALV